MLIAALLDVLVLGCIFAVAAEIFENTPRLRLARDTLFVLSLLIPINVLRKRYHLFAYQSLVDHYGRLATITLALVSVLLAYLLILHRRGAVRVTKVLVLVMAPLPLLIVGQSVFQTFTGAPRAFSTSIGSVRPPTAVNTETDQRVVWLIFDELDQYLLTEGRPTGLELRGFDAFREISLSAEKAVRPGRDTIDAVPAALTRQRMVGADVVGAGSLLLTPCRGEAHVFQSKQTVFASARSLGLTTAMVGWYHPYCRVLADSLTYCYAKPAQSQFVEEIETRNQGLPGMAMDLFKRQLLQLPLAERLGLVHETIPSREAVREERVDHLAEFVDLYHHALEAIRSPYLRFTVVHLPIPHLPALYDRHTQRMDATGKGNYFDNLVLADKVLTDVREALEQSGLWSRTAVLVTSDHPLRVSILRSLPADSAAEERKATGDRERSYIPFLVRLPQETGGVEFTDEIDSSVAGNLALGAATGQLTSYATAAALLKQTARPEPCRNATSTGQSFARETHQTAQRLRSERLPHPPDKVGSPN